MPRNPKTGENRFDPARQDAQAPAGDRGNRVERDDAARGSAPATSPLPAISLPKGGGAIRGIGEKFSANPVTGTGSFAVPLPVSPGRSGFTPQLALSYDTGAGNGPFGWGFGLALPAITRKTEKSLPQYDEAGESDTFILSGAEDLVPVLVGDERYRETRAAGGRVYVVQRYRPRTEGLFARIERWTDTATRSTHWRSVTKENVTSVYGRQVAARIVDPTDPQRVFSWLIEESHDDRGNIIRYEYKPEDATGVDRTAPRERNRLRPAAGFANRYIKRVKYGNSAPFAGEGWLFQIVFDYGEHDESTITPEEDRPWTVRPDPFSSYRAGFEVRSYRRCNRVLMFHRFDELGPTPCLVRSTDLDYGTDSPVASFVRRIVQHGYVRAEDGRTYRQASLPPLELTYSEARIDETLRELDPASLANLPQGLAGSYQWVDLFNEGLTGVLTEQTGAWFYKPNRGGGTFGATQLVAAKPAIANLSSGRQQILDIEADGRNDLVLLQQPLSGFHPQRDDGTWGPFRTFAEAPNVDWSDANLKFVDLTGDGRADILITEDDVWTWYESKGTQGFAAARRVRMALDEEKGPRMLFADGTDSIYLADMSGDGLVDLVRIRNGEVCYWPNVGYGRFGAKVTMDNAPFFDYPDQFSQSRIRMADIDGTGVTDILYLGRQGVNIYFNQSGNSLSDPRVLKGVPQLDNTVSVAVIDLLGNGTACLVFSSTLPGHAGRPVRYVDLMGGEKPHLLVRVVNNLGAETRVRYAPSTRFYLADLAAGRPWITKLPFPVHVLDRIEIYDAVGRSRFVTRYAYHHGHYDGVEREFRGFALVEQSDTEAYATLQAEGLLPPAMNDSDEASHVPPVRTKTWFHTGVHPSETISRGLAREYYRLPDQSDEEFEALLLPDTLLPSGLSPEEERQASRALRGSVLRQEVYADDESARSGVPYAVSERSYAIDIIQRQRSNRHGIFFVRSRETVSYHYERNPADPRVTHELVLEVDDFGNNRRSANISYGREPRVAVSEEQTRLMCTYVESDYTNAIDDADNYRGRMPSENRTYEVTGLGSLVGRREDRLAFDEVDHAVRTAAEIAYEDAPSGGLQKRIVEHLRTYYRKNDLTGTLRLGELESLALQHESYKLALTSGLVSQVYGGRVKQEMLEAGGYVHGEGDADWWRPSGRVFLSPRVDDTAAQELDEARRHFFVPRRERNPFGHDTVVTYDAHDLMPRDVSDQLGNRITADTDYRVLAPSMVLDPNRNRTAARFDVLGMVVATAVMGKEGAGEGDTLDDPTTRLEYDVDAWQERGTPVSFHLLAREQHGAHDCRWQESYGYSDGFGREIQKKIQAEPGPDGAPRWIGSGWTLFNNKGKPVQQYEPFFTAVPDFEFARNEGVSTTVFYDPVTRVVATLHPNHTYQKVVFDAWGQTSWDLNDTVLQDPKEDPDVGGYFARIPDSDYRPTWYEARKDGALGRFEQAAAVKAAAHAATPTVCHFDSLGRSFLDVADNGPDGKYPTRMVMDIEGNRREVVDARSRAVVRYDYDVAGVLIHQASMEAGERWTLGDVSDKPIYAWDSRGHCTRMQYDELRRPTEIFLGEGEGPERLVQRTIYGEDVAGAGDGNLRGQIHQLFDAAGVRTNDAFDFKGNLLRSSRQLALEYRQALDWSADVPLEPRTYTTSTTYDALNRPVSMTTPDQSIVRPVYNEANLLERLESQLRGEPEATVFVGDMDYDAKGQCQRVEYGNGTHTEYAYDPLTLRLTRILTVRGTESVQDLRYTRDAVGNLTHVEDAAQQTIYFRNRRVDPDADYSYDAIYRLVEATGREHLGQLAGGALAPVSRGPDDTAPIGRPHPSDGSAMGRYVQRYIYDQVGNILEMVHRGTDPSSPGWRRQYAYDEASLLEEGKSSNRLSYTSIADEKEPYGYDPHGNMTAMPHLPRMQWDHRDQLQATARQVVNSGPSETTYYVYDSYGQRIRKVTDRAGGTRKDERSYLGLFEIYRRYGGDGGVDLERETLHIMANRQRVALVESQLQSDSSSPSPLIRYQLGSHLESAVLELDEVGQIISYEEYYPHGSTSYQAVRSQTEAPKRYRFTGKERDEESGLYCNGLRCYASWLGRWTSSDPKGIVDGTNTYAYVRNNPVAFSDPTGTQFYPPEYRARALVETINRTAESVAETLRPVTSRIGGGVQVVGGGLEAAGAVGLALTPEPTLATKAGAVVLGAHSLDTLQAGFRSLWYGEAISTVTAEVATAAAVEVGVPEQYAPWAGFGADVLAGVGPAVGVGLSRRFFLVGIEGSAAADVSAARQLVIATEGTLAAEGSGARQVLVVGESHTFEYSMELARQNPNMRIIATRLDPVDPALASALPNLEIRGGVDATRLAEAFPGQSFDDLVFNAPRSVAPGNPWGVSGNLVDDVLASGRDVLPGGGTVRFSGTGGMPAGRRLGGWVRGTGSFPFPQGYMRPPTMTPFLADPVFGVPYTPMTNAGAPVAVTLDNMNWYLFVVE